MPICQETEIAKCRRYRYIAGMRKLPSVAVRLSESERESLERAAVADDRSISAMARRIIAEWLRDNGYAVR